jgi:hypothetical protein
MKKPKKKKVSPEILQSREDKLKLLEKVIEILKTINHIKSLKIKSDKIFNKNYKDLANIKLETFTHCINWLNNFKSESFAKYLEADAWIPESQKTFYRMTGVKGLPEQIKLETIKNIMLANWEKRPNILKITKKS